MTLLHPELIQDIPFVGNIAATVLDERSQETLKDDPSQDPQITVAIRARNEAAKLERLLQDVSQQTVGSSVELIVVDNESTDHTRSIAREYGAAVINLAASDFTYPRSMNLCMEAASHDSVFLTVGHAQLSTDYTLHAGARHFKADGEVGGVFSIVLPTAEASRTERVGSICLVPELFRKPRVIKKASMAVMAATGAFFSRTAWQELGQFDERYQTGGEDTALAAKMLANGLTIIKDPALAVHHAHNLGPIAMTKELAHYAKTLRAPRKFEGTIQQRRQARFSNPTN